MLPTLTIGVFDSGFGGLTVLRELLPRIPGGHFLYLGDTARLPYGAKSQATVARYAVEAARFLASRGAKLLVIACNTATALALDDIRRAVPVPVIGVIEPAVEMARRSQSGTDVLVLATQATVHSHAYERACAAHGLRATEKACPLLVPLVEEGWIDHPVTRDVLRIYLREALSTNEALSTGEALARSTPTAVLLGCTHYPLLAPAIAATLRDLGTEVPVINSALATAQAVVATLGSTHTTPYVNRTSTQGNPGTTTPGTPPNIPAATFECFATDSIEKFAHLGSLFLGRPIPHVHLLDLGG